MEHLAAAAPMLAAAGAAVIAGALLTAQPRLAFVLVCAPVLLLLLTTALARLLVVSFGALLTFQASSDLSMLKTAYSVCVLFSFVGALVSLSKHRALARGLPERDLGTAAGIMLSLTLLSVVPALVYATPLLDWSRDSFSYLLFGAAPLLAVDYARHVTNRSLTLVFIVCGFIATASFFVSWIARRSTSELEISTLAFSSFLLPVALIAFATAHALRRGARRLAWATVASGVFLALLATGTRSSILAGVAVLVAVTLAPSSLGTRTLGVAAIAATAIGLATVALHGGLATSLIDVEATRGRLATVTSAISNPSDDASLAGRRRQTSTAMGWFERAPLMGVGPGHPLTADYGLGGPDGGYFVDSPVGFLAKFGLLGMASIFVMLALFGRFLAQVGARATPSGLALIAFLATTTAWSFLGTPFDDKGFALAMSLLLALTLQETVAHRPTWPCQR
jgi:O-antigen ligase